MSGLAREVVEEAFAYFKERREVVQFMAQARIRPGPHDKPPTDSDYKKWTLEQWAGFLYRYVTPRKKRPI